MVQHRAASFLSPSTRLNHGNFPGPQGCHICRPLGSLQCCVSTSLVVLCAVPPSRRRSLQPALRCSSGDLLCLCAWGGGECRVVLCRRLGSSLWFLNIILTLRSPRARSQLSSPLSVTLTKSPRSSGSQRTCKKRRRPLQPLRFRGICVPVPEPRACYALVFILLFMATRIW